MASLSRRHFIRLSTAGTVSLTGATFLSRLAAATARNPERLRSCILLWMPGGPSQTDTFDMKPDHENGGSFKPISTSVPGIQVSEHLPQVSKWMHQLAPIRSMSTKEGDHSRAMYLIRTGRVPAGPIRFPAIGSLVGKEFAGRVADLPDYVSIGPNNVLSPAAFGPGFLGPRYAPLTVGGTYNYGQAEASLDVRNLQPTVSDASHMDARLGLLAGLEDRFLSKHPDPATESRQAAYDQAVRMMRGRARQVLDLSRETDGLRDRYGRNQFGQGCLLARRLVENGVPFVEVSLNSAPETNVFGWDTHAQNFESTRKLCQVLDPGWATLMEDLQMRGLLDTTLIVWMGEFGRTPGINGASGRDHFPNAWTTVVGGGGIRGGQVIGATSADGMQVDDSPVAVPDLLATICQALGIDPMKQNLSNVGRPIRLVEPDAEPIKELLI